MMYVIFSIIKCNYNLYVTDLATNSIVNIVIDARLTLYFASFFFGCVTISDHYYLGVIFDMP